MAQLKALIHRGSLGIPGFKPWAISPLPDASLAGGMDRFNAFVLIVFVDSCDGRCRALLSPNVRM